MTAIVRVLAGLLIVAATAADANAQCPSGKQPLQDLVNADIEKEVIRQLPELVDAAVRDVPRFTTRDKQDSAPSANGSLASIVDSTGFSSLLSAAFDQVVGGQDSDDDGLVTLNASPFLFAVASDSSIYYDQRRYEEQQFDIMRRIGATASFGGKGVAFDRDGDGTTDDALTSSSFSDVVTWEARFLVSPRTRDRRDPRNFAKLEEAANAVARERLGNEIAALGLDPLVFKLIDRSSGLTCIEPSAWEAVKPLVKERIDAVIVAAVAANRAFQEAAEEIDRQLQVTLALTGVERSKDFGPNTIGVGLRASWYDFTGNFDWGNSDPIPNSGTTSDSNQFSIGAKYSRPILQKWITEEGFDVSLAADVDIYDHVPEAAHDTNVKVQGAFEIPITTGITIPLSITWANHEDLLSEDDTIVGRFGINVDTSKVLDMVGGES